MSSIKLSVSVGNELQSIDVSTQEWQSIQAGEVLVKEVQGIYEGEVFTYTWHFNDPKFPDTSLVVMYGDGEGFIGSIDHVFTS